MRFLCRAWRYNDKVGTKDFIIIVIYIVKFSSMTLTVSKAFIYIYKVLNGNHPNSSAFILFLPSFFYFSLARMTKENVCHEPNERETKNRSNLVGEICLLFEHFTLRETHLLNFNHIHNLLKLQGERENFDSFR